MDLVEVLTLHTPPGELKNTIAVCIPHPGSTTVPLSAFSECQPLSVLHTRLHHPWIMEDVCSRVESHLQPIVDLMRGGQVYAYEALCRIRTPSGRLLAGYEVFTLAKRANRTQALDLSCMKNALFTKARVLNEGTPIFVNILPHNLVQTNSVCHPLQELSQSLRIPPQEIVIELVESEQVDPEALVDACDTLRKMGFRIALDDVGAGYNGLTTLATLRPDFVKLDRNLVHGIQGSRVRMVLLEALISMSQRLGCATIAEGLEQPEDIIVCQEMGVHYAQGYYFAHPSPEPVKPKPVPIPKVTAKLSLRGMIRLADFVDHPPTLPITATVAEAQILLKAFPDLPFLVVQDDKHPVGYASRSTLTTAYGIDLLIGHCHPVTRMIKDSVSKMELARRFYKDKDDSQPWIVVNEESTYLGTIQPWIVLSQILSGGDQLDLHPLSLLPTGPILRSTLDLNLQTAKKVLLIYIDIDNFKAFNDRYGFIRGDAMIKLLAEIIRHERSTWSDACMGHIGGDDFIVMLFQEMPNLKEKLQNMIDSFQRLSAHLYDSKDIQCGFFVTEDGDRYPVAALSIIVVNGSQGSLSDSLKASERAAHLKKLAKAHPGSVIVVEGIPPRLIPVRLNMRSGSWQDYVIGILDRISSYKRDKNHHDLDAAFKDYPFFELIYELDSRGVQRYPNWVNPKMRGRITGGGVGIDRSSRSYFQTIRQTLAPNVSNIYVSSASEDFCVTVSVPLFDEQHAFSGVLVADINLPGLVELFRRPSGFGMGLI